MFTDLLHGIRFTVRELRRAPAFMGAALLSLIIGIGATTAVFGLVRALLLRPLPFEDEANLVRIFQVPEGTTNLISLRPVTYGGIEEQQRSFSSMVAQRYSASTLLGNEGFAERIVTISVSRDWLGTLGVQPLQGRGFTPDESELGRDASVTVISHLLWQRHFGGAADVLGRTVTIDNRTRTVVGVMPPGFRYPYHADAWLPMRVDPLGDNTWGLNVQARLRPGVTTDQAAQDLRAINQRLVLDHPDRHRGAMLRAYPLRDTMVGEQDRLALMLFGAVVFVLLIVCANMANLFLARGLDRQRQFAMRAALGASRTRLVREMFAESLVVALLGGLLGFAAALGTAQFLVTLFPNHLSFVVTDVPIDATAFTFSMAAAVATALAFGIVPAWRTTGTDPAQLLQGGTRSVTRRRTLSADALVVSEVALAFVLLAAAGLLVRNLQSLQQVELGYDPERLWILTTAVDRPDYDDPERRLVYVDRVQEALRQLADVSSAGTSTMFPWSRSNTLARIEIEGRQLTESEQPIVNHRAVTPAFLETLGVPLIRGRQIDSRDVESGIPVAVISQRMAARYWPNEDAIGRRVRSLGSSGPDPWRTVIGVVGDVHEAEDPYETWYVPYAQDAAGALAGNLVFVARVRGDGVTEDRVRRTVASVDPTLAVGDVFPATLVHAESIAGERFTTRLIGAFALAGLLMAAIGIYGVLAYTVARRTREIGVQLALGASPGAILRTVLRYGSTLVAVGLVLGILGAFSMIRVLRSAVPELSVVDPTTMAIAIAVLTAVALLASYVPARRAMRADPIQALRAE